MLSASFNLIYDGQEFGPALLVCGLFVGAAFIWASKRFLKEHDGLMLGDVRAWVPGGGPSVAFRLRDAVCMVLCALVRCQRLRQCTPPSCLSGAAAFMLC